MLRRGERFTTVTANTLDPTGGLGSLSFSQILNLSPWHIFEIRKWDDSKNLFLRFPKIELGTYWSDDPSWSGQIIRFALDNRPHRPSSLHVPVRTSTHLKDAFTLATPLIRLIRNSFCILRLVTQSDAHEFTQVVYKVVNIVIYGSSLGLKLRVAQTLFYNSPYFFTGPPLINPCF